jgi:MFS family permease
MMKRTSRAAISKAMLWWSFLAYASIDGSSITPSAAIRRNSKTPSLFVASLRPGDYPISAERRRNVSSSETRRERTRFDVSPRDSSKTANFRDLRGGDANESSEINHTAKAKQMQSTFGISLSLFLTYLTVMGAKCALPSTLPLITSPQSGLAHYSTSLSRQDVISRLLAFSTLSIAVGKLALGPIIDSIGGVKSLQIALSTLFLCLGLIGFRPQTCPTLTSLAGYWIVVDFAFSSCWAACVKTIRDYMEEKNWSKEIGRLAMAARIGNAASFAFFAWLLQWATGRDNFSAGARPITEKDIVDTSWRWVFRVSSAIQLVPLAFLYFNERKSTVVQNKTDQARTTMKQSLAILNRESRTMEFWLHLLSRTIIMLLISFLLFIPTYMSECFEMSTSSSARVGSFFAMGCLSSVLTLSEKTYPPSSGAAAYKQKSWAMLFLLAISTCCLSIQYAFLRGIIQLSSVVGSLLMFAWGFALAIPFYIPASMFALRRGGKEGSATMTDIIDGCGFGLLAIFNSYVAKVLNVSDPKGLGGVFGRKQAWSPVFLWMLGGSAVSMISMFFAVRFEGKNSEKL